MKINLLSPIKFNFNKFGLKKENKPVCLNNKTKSFSYPKNYYINQIHFGKTNKEIYEQMENASSLDEVMKLFNELPDNVKNKVYAVVNIFKDNGLTLLKPPSYSASLLKP